MSLSMDCVINPIAYYDALYGETFQRELLNVLKYSSDKVPLLNATPLDSIPEGHIVCIYGMIQDMFNTEIYVNEFKHTDTGICHSCKYRDFTSSEFNPEENSKDIKFSERQSFYIVPIPGESLWVREAHAKSHGSVECMVALGDKRASVGDGSSMYTKKLKADDGSRKVSLGDQKSRKQFPLSEEEEDESRTGFLVRVYDSTFTDSLKLNELVRIYGILQHARLGAGFDQDDCARDAKGPQPVPHLHAVIVQRLPHNNPYFGLASQLFTVSTPADEQVGQQLCGRLQQLMAQIVPQLATVAVTLDSLNSGPLLTPTRDADRGVMNASRLQLPDATQVLVDETSMTVGRLDARGLLNLRALTMLATEQRVPYDFQFYSLDWDTRVRMLVVSAGVSLIKPTLIVPWVATSKIASTTIYSDEDLVDIRHLLTVASQPDSVYFTDEGLQEVINSDFVNWRREKDTFIEANEFAQMLCLLRLFCVSHGNMTSSLDDWKYICSLENERKKRLKQMN